MKTKIISSLLVVLFFVALDGCKKDDPAPANGRVVFWNKTGDGLGDVEVTVNGVVKTITADFIGAPACDAAGSASFSLAPGDYTYSAREINGTPPLITWTNSFTVTSNGCLTKRLCASSC